MPSGLRDNLTLSVVTHWEMWEHVMVFVMCSLQVNRISRTLLIQDYPVNMIVLLFQWVEGQPYQWTGKHGIEWSSPFLVRDVIRQVQMQIQSLWVPILLFPGVWHALQCCQSDTAWWSLPIDWLESWRPLVTKQCIGVEKKGAFENPTAKGEN